MSDARWIEVLKTPINLTMVEQFVVHPAAGGTCVFAGTTRAERSADGRQLVALDYEAYVELAIKQLNGLASRTNSGWPVKKLAILHRVGRVNVGEVSVLIAVSSPHRADAFEACRFVIDELKREVAIWKNEIWSTGPAKWVE